MLISSEIYITVLCLLCILLKVLSGVGMKGFLALFGIILLTSIFLAEASFSQEINSGSDSLFTLEQLINSDYKPILVNFDTDKGSFLIAVYPDIAPISSENFLRLVQEGFYDEIVVHRVVAEFVMQAGEIKEGSKKSKLLRTIKDEPTKVHHEPGTVSFAKLYDVEKKEYIPDSAEAQFFINLGHNERLDANFTVFGYVFWGMEVVREIEVGDRILRAYIVNELL